MCIFRFWRGKDIVERVGFGPSAQAEMKYDLTPRGERYEIVLFNLDDAKRYADYYRVRVVKWDGTVIYDGRKGGAK